METNLIIDRATGEVLPSLDKFVHCELGSITNDKFRRNVLANHSKDLERWRSRNNNTGIFTSLLMSNERDYLEKYNDPDTLFYAPLTFDMDASKDPSEENWAALVHETRTLINHLVSTWKLDSADCIRVWFSGGRGFHIEVPAEVLGIYPHHDLNRIFSRAAIEAARNCELLFLDMSLYGGKHLYRMGNSIHQRTGSYKWPMKASELAKAYDYSFLAKVSKKPRAITENFWTKPTLKIETARTWDQLVKDTMNAANTKKTISLIQNSPETYNRSDFRCMEMQFEDGYIVPEGMRYSVAYILAMHLYQNSFSYEAAEAEMMKWATEHCSPAYIEEEDLIEWHRMLDQVYEGTKHPIGCGYIQRVANAICEESVCPIAQRMKKSLSKQLPSIMSPSKKQMTYSQTLKSAR